ncbi:MAG: putative DNA binding domain-containing protein [Erysipelotrichaceae bacterium]|nr:putative DNA binding domain-containing protein [Erysipelotrichaceae bacterium]
MIYVESETIELKSKFTDTICKDIVAFLNTSGGDVIIGVEDNGNVIGVTAIDETYKKISDVITNQIEPNPQDIISSEIRYDEGKMILVIHVQKGVRPLYCQKKYGFSSAGCVMRVGTTCRNMTPEQIRIRYEKNFTDSDLIIHTPARYGTISFKTLKVYYAEKGYHLEASSFEANLNLRTPGGEYNLLAELLSDKNMIPLITVKFHGTDKASVSERNDYGNQCLLFSYEQIRNRLSAENLCVSDTTVRPRVDKYLFDFDSANEAVINALVHNDWNISQPLISFFNDRMEILSHGGLPKGQTRELFFRGISKPRNDMLMRIFMNMNLSEHTGHGVPAILAKYGETVFDIGDSYILVTIPFDKTVLNTISKKQDVGKNAGIHVGLNTTEKKVIDHIMEQPKATMESIAKEVGVTKRTIERTMRKLQGSGIVMRIGTKRSGQWILMK